MSITQFPDYSLENEKAIRVMECLVNGRVFNARFNSRFKEDSHHFIRIVHYHINETSLRRAESL